MAEESIVGVTALASKRVIYVGGLGDGATVQLVRAAMIPFGPIQSVDIVSAKLRVVCCCVVSSTR
jgi:hypothetical protein